MARSKGRTGRPWERLASSVKARRDPCWLCGYPIDYDAEPRTRWSFSVDHIVPLSQGGTPRDPANLAAAHYGCNSRKGNGTTQTLSRPVTSRLW